MKIGLFFGSFNPVHTGHLIIANFMVEFTNLDKVWFVVSPQNPLKTQLSLLNEFDRMEFIRLSIEDNDKLEVSDIEFNMPRPSYTIDTLVYLQEKHPGQEFVLLMGTDTLMTLPRWKNYEQLLDNYAIYAYPRPGSQRSELESHFKVSVFDAPLMKISASFIRDAIREGKSVQYLVPEPVRKYIDRWGFYRG
ncbi:MAG: nicotinate (nicotinamide) nucleotide adenylyltransferase [Bacteroidia bacterium]